MYPVTSSLESITKCVLLHLSYFVYFFWKGFSFDHWHLFYACATTIHSSISVANEIFFFLLFSLFCLLSFFQAKMTGETKFCERVLISQLFTCGSFFHVEYFFFLFFFLFSGLSERCLLSYLHFWKQVVVVLEVIRSQTFVYNNKWGPIWIRSKVPQ